MDAKAQLLESWEINNRLNLYLLDAIPPELMQVKLEKGKTIEGQFAHIHNVRLMWLKASAPDLHETQTKAEGGEALGALLNTSGAAIAELLSRSIDNGGKVKGFKPHVTAFLCYLVAHESFHRTQVEVSLRQNGTPLSDKVAYGLWEWGVR